MSSAWRGGGSWRGHDPFLLVIAGHDVAQPRPARLFSYCVDMTRFCWYTALTA